MLELHVLHMLLPAGERGFIRVFKRALDEGLVQDDDLRHQMRWFIAQEGAHARTHAIAATWLADSGVSPDRFTRRMERLFAVLMTPRPRRWAHARLCWQLALVAGFEHFTSWLGRWAFDDQQLDVLGADPVMCDLLRWHAAEEVEHRHVAHAVHAAAQQHFVYLTRAVATVAVAAMIPVIVISGTRALMAADPSMPHSRFSVRRLLADGRAGRIPSVPALVASGVMVLHRSYDPRHDLRPVNAAKAADFLADIMPASPIGPRASDQVSAGDAG